MLEFIIFSTFVVRYNIKNKKYHKKYEFYIDNRFLVRFYLLTLKNKKYFST